MKNKFHPALIALLLSVLFTQFSCTKDTIQPTGGSKDNPALAGKSNSEIQPFYFTDESTGGLYLEVAPLEAKAVVTVYNDTNTYGPFAVNYFEGVIKLSNLVSGFYKVQIKPINAVYQPVLIDNVEITADNKTNLGLVELGF
jgi:hypothetical protein